jgi:hypothetical protein
MVNRLINWITVEPTISLLMAITAVVLFGSTLTRSKDTSDRFWPWFRRIIEASIGAFLFLGLLWAFRAILNNNIVTFNSTHGSLSEANRQSAQSIWGKPHIQRELIVSHFIETTKQEEIPRADPSQPPVYRNVQVREQVPQNSIVGFVGDVNLTVSEREKGYALYSGYIIDARYEYEVINDSELETEVEFYFPLSPGQTMHENFQITVDGQDIGSQLQFYSADWVKWIDKMRPGQRHTVVVSYTSRGMETFYYQIPGQRNIQNFRLTLTVDRLPVDLLNYPEGCLTPTEIQPTPDGKGSILTWRLDKAITVAGMGVALTKPEQSGAKVLRLLYNSPYALTLLGTMLALTLLIRGEPIHFLDLALLSGAYCVQFLVMAATSDWGLGFWGSLVLGIALTGTLTWLLFRRLPSKLHRVLIYALTGFFTVIYPLSGLLTQAMHRNTVDGLVQVAMIVYLFGLSLYTRIEGGANRITSVEREAL